MLRNSCQYTEWPFVFLPKALTTFKLSRFQVRYFVIGKDDQYPITDPAPIISDVVVVETSSR